jgi:predicted acetyltransferase
MKYRQATLADCGLLAQLNHQLIEDEGYKQCQTVPELEARMRAWLTSKYSAMLFVKGAETVAYALYWEQRDEVYLRHLFVVRHRRRQGIGRAAMHILRSRVWPPGRRLTVEALVRNAPAIAFWRAIGYRDYSLKLEIPAT